MPELPEGWPHNALKSIKIIFPYSPSHDAIMLLNLFHVVHSEELILVSTELMMSSVYNLHKYGYVQINCCSTSAIFAFRGKNIIAQRCVYSKVAFCVVAVYEAINGLPQLTKCHCTAVQYNYGTKEWILLSLCHKPSNAKEKKIVSLLWARRVWQFLLLAGIFQSGKMME